MKTLYLTSILLFHLAFAHSQTGNYEAKLKKHKQKIEQDVIKLKSELEKRVKSTAFLKQVIIDFTIDTFRIEQLLSAKLKLDQSNAGMENSYIEAEIDYQKLLDKYNQLLLSKLNEQDKAILKQSQFSWMQFYNSELNLNNTISKEEYTGGGTMQGLFNAYRFLEIKRRRVVDIYLYLNKMQMI